MIEVKNITKVFKDGERETTVLRGINLVIESGEYVAIMGRSGAGKSTLMYQMSLLDTPTSGDIIIDSTRVSELNEEAKSRFRLERLGYVFQDYALVPELTAIENVMLPLMMNKHDMNTARPTAARALERVGLQSRLHNIPSALSGGEQQRVGIARAIAHQPSILFADEPTANLDSESANRVIDIFDELHASGQTIIMVTHEEAYGKRAEKIIFLEDGQIVSVRNNR